MGYFERMLAAEMVDVAAGGRDLCGVTDGSTLPTQGATNPALRVMALVARAADVVGKAAPRRCSSHEVHK